MSNATVTITPRSATPAANDVLTVTGDVVIEFGGDTYTCPLSATGWVSATQQHYPSDAYTAGDQGTQLAEGAEPRAMTPDEVADYCRQLLVDSFVASTPLVKQSAPNLLDAPATPAPAPTPTPPPTEAAPPAAPEAEPAPAPQAQPAPEGAPPMTGNEAPPAPRM